MAQKPYNTKSLQDRLGELSPEEGGRGKAGVYWHPESGNEAITLSDPLFGEAQSNAFERLGFVRVRDARPDEIHQVFDFSLAQSNVETDSLKGLSARMNRLEDEKKSLEAEVERFRAEAANRKDGTSDTIHDAKVAAAEQLKLRGQGDATDQVGPRPGSQDQEQSQTDGSKSETGSQEEEKPLEEQNATELRETADREGVDSEGLNTVQEFRDAIQAARFSKKESEQA